MGKWLLNFLTVAFAVLAALYLFQRLQPSPKADMNAVSLLTAQQQIIHDDSMRALNAVKVSLQEYYVNSGKWPQSNAVAGLPPPDAFRGKSLVRLDVSELTITMTFDGKSGVSGGRIIFTGNPTPQLVMGIHWKCASPSYPDVAVAIPDCVYSGP